MSTRSVCFFILVTFFITSGVSAGEKKSVDQMINALKFEKLQAEAMINKMTQSGRMNHEEASRAKREIASVQEESIHEIKTEALDELKSSNSLATK